MALTGVYGVLVILDAGSPGPLRFAEEWPIAVLYGALSVSFPTVGALIAARHPRNPIGWMFCASGIAIAAGFAATLYGDYGTYVRPGLPGAAYAALGNHGFIVGLTVATIFVLFLFPTGRPLSRSWRRVMVGTAVAFVVGLSGSLLQPGPLEPFADIRNPLGLTGLPGALAAGAAGLLDATAPVVFLLGIWSLTARFRRSRGAEHQQLKLFVYAATVMGGLFATGFTLSILELQRGADVFWAGGMLAFAFLPVAVGLAILRHGLYEIDRIVSRTVAYALLTLLLGGLYLAVVLVLAPVVGRGSDLAVVGSTLVVAAAFQPARRRIQALVDRRFNRSRYDAEQVVRVFRARLRRQVDLADVIDAMHEVVVRTVDPARTTVWLRREPSR